jgi:hypothetical protein
MFLILVFSLSAKPELYKEIIEHVQVIEQASIQAFHIILLLIGVLALIVAILKVIHRESKKILLH